LRDGGETRPSLAGARQALATAVDQGFVKPEAARCAEETLQWVQQLGLDEASEIACLIFPIYSEAPETHPALKKHWGEDIAGLLISMHRISHLRVQVDAEGQNDTPRQTEILRRMVLALAEDIRAVIIRLAAHVIRLELIAQQLKASPSEAVAAAGQAIGRETLRVQAPLANRLGIWQLKWALEDLAFRITEPQVYRQIAALLEETRAAREAFVAKTIEQLQAMLLAAEIPGEVAGRPKHLFSIRNKMNAKSLRFDQLRDLRAFRILVDTEAQCYGVLGLLHDHWTPMAAEFDDYITRPKANGYQSLHTVLLDEDQRPFEVQIRTHQMHHRAELGVAAHWKYKEQGQAGLGPTDEDQISWLRQMLDWSRSDLGQVRLSDDRVYALTPKARIVELPGGGTPLDFAYQLHTELGHRCRGAKLDGQIVPLTTAIRTGQTVELMTVRQGGPSRDWMNPESGYLKSPRARQKVRSWFHAQDLAAGVTTDKVTEDASRQDARAADRTAAATDLILSRIGQTRPAGKGQVLVVGVDRMLTALARCCKPAPPDDIAGFVTRGRGVSVHRQGCATFQRMAREKPERVIETAWGRTNPEDQVRYSVDLTLLAHARPDLLRDLAEVLAREKIPMTRVHAFPKVDRVTMAMTVQVLDGEQLNRGLLLLRGVQGVLSVARD